MTAWVIWIGLGVFAGWLLYRVSSFGVKQSLVVIVLLTVAIIMQVMWQITPIEVAATDDLCRQIFDSAIVVTVAYLALMFFANPLSWTSMC